MYHPAQHGLPDLLTHLVGVYRTTLEAQNRTLSQQRGPRGEPPRQINVEEELDRLKHFLSFSRSYLSHNRPSTLTHTDRNYAVQLTNGTQVLISPPVAEPARSGQLQPSTSVPVTGVGSHVSPDEARQMGLYVGDGAVAVSGVQPAPYELPQAAPQPAPQVVRVPPQANPQPAPGPYGADYTLPQPE